MSDQELDIATHTSKKDIILKLGDVIIIDAATNPQLNENAFYVVYVDDQMIELNNISSFEPITLHLDENGILTDESIQQIRLDSRSEESGYARQHLLLPKTWIDIHFGGEIPMIITGEITNLEGDMIEITTFPDMDTLYIDFSFKGIPKYIPIDSIIRRQKPASLEKISSLVDIREQYATEGADVFEREIEPSASMHYSETGDIIIQTPENAQADNTFHEELHELYSQANEIIYGEILGDHIQREELPEYQQRYSIETQVNDLQDELLMKVPNEKRTLQVKAQIHQLIERFRELRVTIFQV